MVVVENRELPLGEVDLDPYGAPRVPERYLARLHPGDAVVAQRCVPDRDPAAVELHRRKHLRRPELGRVADEAEQAPSGAPEREPSSRSNAHDEVVGVGLTVQERALAERRDRLVSVTREPECRAYSEQRCYSRRNER